RWLPARPEDWRAWSWGRSRALHAVAAHRAQLFAACPDAGVHPARDAKRKAVEKLDDAASQAAGPRGPARMASLPAGGSHPSPGSRS
ncbi:MAG: hypothetical protein JWM27_341, partial [Gemmatimonadetes bacterium]|nr:hypothetical protein [Gemmatimonadota bacterium]